MKYVILALSLGLLSGCNMTATIDEIVPTSITKIVSQKLTGAEFNSGARNNLTTNDIAMGPAHYNVSYSMGNTSQKLKTTTAGGYQVFTSVQGKVISEGP